MCAQVPEVKIKGTGILLVRQIAILRMFACSMWLEKIGTGNAGDLSSTDESTPPPLALSLLTFHSSSSAKPNVFRNRGNRSVWHPSLNRSTRARRPTSTVPLCKISTLHGPTVPVPASKACRPSLLGSSPKMRWKRKTRGQEQKQR